ncbi:hypothetical protein GCM10023320_23000 [Pseudonocardia adelaidensis]|uniref:Uncharacterized protein n=1 Tax=Pseudonocardia adelaidensis TaxID=648754 RepID=A0ABP9NGG4_9PSEU
MRPILRQKIAVDGGESDVPLQRTVEEGGAVRQGDGGLEGGEGWGRRPDAPRAGLGGFGDVGAVEVTAAQPDAGSRSWLGVGRHGEVDDRGGPVEHVVPVGNRRPGDDGGGAGPEPGGANAGFGSGAVAADQVDAWVQAGPAAFPDAALHGGG